MENGKTHPLSVECFTSKTNHSPWLKISKYFYHTKFIQNSWPQRVETAETSSRLYTNGNTILCIALSMARQALWIEERYLVIRFIISDVGCILYEAAALMPPFTATSMDGLYKKVWIFVIQVMKGVYPRLPAQYS